MEREPKLKQYEREGKLTTKQIEKNVDCLIFTDKDEISEEILNFRIDCIYTYSIMQKIINTPLITRINTITIYVVDKETDEIVYSTYVNKVGEIDLEENINSTIILLTNRTYKSLSGKFDSNLNFYNILLNIFKLLFSKIINNVKSKLTIEDFNEYMMYKILTELDKKS